MHSLTDSTAAEMTRLEAVRRLKISDSPYECLFNTITRAISEVCHTPIALISFVEKDRQWFKSKIGLEGYAVTPIEQSFCAYTLLSQQAMEVQDAALDERFKNNPLVTGSPNIRFYAGAPITLPLGERIGTLCVIDTQANQLNEYKKAALEGFARVISQTLLIRDVHSRSTSRSLF